jgi:hypothetical protein
MRYDDTKAAFECILNCLKGQMLKAESKLRAETIRRLDNQLHGDSRAAEKSNGFAPIRGVRYDTMVKPEHRRSWAFRKPRSTSKASKKPLTADDILASI